MKASRRAGPWSGALAAWALVTWSSAVAAPNLRYAKPITTPALDKEELAEVVLDSDVYEATLDGLADVRILDSAGNETPYLRRAATVVRTTKQRRTWTARSPQVKLLDDDGLQITVELGAKDPAPQGLRLMTPLVNFEQRVRVSSSADGETWTPVVEDGVIFDYSQFMDVRSDSLEFSPAADGAPRGRRWRIVIDDVTSEQQSQLMELTRRLRGDDETDRSERLTIVRQPFRIDRIEFFADVQEKGATDWREVAYAVKADEARQDAEAKQTIVTVSTQREPLTKLRLVTADRNFSRAARVEVERPGKNGSRWETLGDATVSRIDFRDLKRESLDIAIPETRAASLRVVVENRDSPPLAVTGVEAQGIAYAVVFLAKPTEKYLLAYGSGAMADPNYDTAAVAASLAADYQPVVGELGEQMQLSSAEDVLPAEPLLARILNSPAFLTTAVALLVVVLGIGLYRASRRVDRLPP